MATVTITLNSDNTGSRSWGAGRSISYTSNATISGKTVALGYVISPDISNIKYVSGGYVTFDVTYSAHCTISPVITLTSVPLMALNFAGQPTATNAESVTLSPIDGVCGMSSGSSAGWATLYQNNGTKEFNLGYIRGVKLKLSSGSTSTITQKFDITKLGVFSQRLSLSFSATVSSAGTRVTVTYMNGDTEVGKQTMTRGAALYSTRTQPVKSSSTKTSSACTIYFNNNFTSGESQSYNKTNTYSYTPAGWSLNKSGTPIIKSGWIVDNDTTLWSQYEEKKSAPTYESLKRQPAGKSVLGYQFNGWQLTDGDGKVSDNNSSYIAMYVPLQYNVSFNLNEQKISPKSKAVWKGAVPKVFNDGNTRFFQCADNSPRSTRGTYSVAITTEEPVAWGYKFKGWSLSPDSQTFVHSSKDIEDKMTTFTSVTLYAQWEKLTDTIVVHYLNNATKNLSVNIDSSWILDSKTLGLSLPEDYAIYGLSAIWNDTAIKSSRDDFNGQLASKWTNAGSDHQAYGFYPDPTKADYTNRYPYQVGYFTDKLNAYKTLTNKSEANTLIPWGQTVHVYVTTTKSGKYVFVDGDWVKALGMYVMQDGQWRFVKWEETLMNGHWVAERSKY